MGVPRDALLRPTRCDKVEVKLSKLEAGADGHFLSVSKGVQDLTISSRLDPVYFAERSSLSKGLTDTKSCVA